MSELSITELSKELRSAIQSLETTGNLDEVGVVWIFYIIKKAPTDGA